MNPTSNGIDVAKVHLIILIGLSLMIQESLFAQYENYTWYNRGAQLQFDLQTKRARVSLLPNTLSGENGAMLNDPTTGEPLFYTDGITVYNRLHEVMENGTAMGTSQTNAQGTAIVNIPGECNQYYLFTSGLDDPDGLCVSKVNLNANQHCKTLIVKPEASTRYEVVVTDANGCRDTAFVQVNVRDVRLYFPNAIYPFSVNNPNKTFFPQGDASKIKWMDLKVFKRWGDMVYSYQGKELINDASLGWDGSFRGKPSPIGEYVYACVVQFQDGTMYTYKGEVMLLR